MGWQSVFEAVSCISFADVGKLSPNMANEVVRACYEVVRALNAAISQGYGEYSRLCSFNKSHREYYKRFGGYAPSYDAQRQCKAKLDAIKEAKSKILAKVDEIKSRKPWSYDVGFSNSIQELHGILVDRTL